MMMRWRTYSSEFRAIKVPVPPLSEQQAIADYLDEKCAAIDAMVAEKEALIADLEAYKKSLIYEAVTGKREVA
jgi:type I restriction enzyme S subunit